MASKEYVESVETLIADSLTVAAGIEVLRATTGQLGRDPRVERVIRQAVLAALRLAREQLAAPRVGTMTFDEAMRAVTRGRMVARPGWGILRALTGWPADEDDPEAEDEVEDMDLDNVDGGRTGCGSRYCPTEEDRAATDWMDYRPPDINLCVRFWE